MNRYYGLIVVTAFFSALSQILLNISAKKERRSRIFEYLNPYVITSYAILFAVLALNIYALRFVELKFAHAVAASTYAFVLVLSRIILKEKLTPKKILGNLIIIIGIIVFVWK